MSIHKYPAILFKRLRTTQDALRKTLGSDYEAFLTAQVYRGSAHLWRERKTAFSFVVMDGRVHFPRRVTEIQDMTGIENWDGGIHVATTSDVPPSVAALEGSLFNSPFRSTKKVFVCFDDEADRVWFEDEHGPLPALGGVTYPVG